MAVEKSETNKTLHEQFKEQHAEFVYQKELAQANIYQLTGAIFATEAMIKKLEENMAKEEEGGNGDGEADN